VINDSTTLCTVQTADILYAKRSLIGCSQATLVTSRVNMTAKSSKVVARYDEFRDAVWKSKARERGRVMIRVRIGVRFRVGARCSLIITRWERVYHMGIL